MGSSLPGVWVALLYNVDGQGLPSGYPLPSQSKPLSHTTTQPVSERGLCSPKPSLCQGEHLFSQACMNIDRPGCLPTQDAVPGPPDVPIPLGVQGQSLEAMKPLAPVGFQVLPHWSAASPSWSPLGKGLPPQPRIHEDCHGARYFLLALKVR